MQPKYEASKTSMGRGEQSRVTSPSLDQLSLSELGKVSAAYCVEMGNVSAALIDDIGDPPNTRGLA